MHKHGVVDDQPMHGRVFPARILLWLLVAFLAMWLLMALAGSFWGGTGWMWQGSGMMGFAWGWMAVPIVVMALMMWGMMSMHHGHGSHRSHGGEDAVAVLDRRYASGDVSREEYLRMKEDLRRVPPR